MRAEVLLALLLAWPAHAGAEDLPWIPRVPGSAFDYTLPDDYLPGRVVLKFAEGTGVRLVEGRFQLREERLDARRLPPALALDDLPARLRVIETEMLDHPAAGEPTSLFNADENLLASLKSNGEAATGRQLADLGLYFSIPLAEGTTVAEIAELLDQLNAEAAVEVAYAEPVPQPATASAGAVQTPDFMQWQSYLDPAPLGIDVREAWRHNQGRGGHGTDVRVVDVEAAWRESHEDLPGLFYQGGVEVPQGWEEHGTAVLGIMAGVDNGLGVHGIADQASYGAQSIFPSGVAAAIFTAATAAGEGGIVVLEVQAPGPWGAANCTCNWGQCGLIPMEYWQAEFDAIALATANCVIVVEAGANGSSDLDNPIYLGAFNRGVRDSGAIFVAASLKDWRMRICFSNHGSRMDLHAWGELIVTTGYGYLWAGLGPDQYYTNSFGGTSGATPIVAGAAAALQGAQKGYGRPPLAPENMLHVLRHGATPQIGTGIIGPMPNLRNSVSLLPYNPRVCSGKGKPQVPNLPQYPDENEPQ